MNFLPNIILNLILNLLYLILDLNIMKYEVLNSVSTFERTEAVYLKITI